MYSEITNSIRVSVNPVFLEEQSSPEKSLYIWAYEVRIENLGQTSVQLLNRHWSITDALGQTQTVRGPGVVGEQPVIPPLDDYEYVSGCHLSTEIGKMHGYYIMEHVGSGRQFKVKIPNFVLTADLKLN